MTTAERILGAFSLRSGARALFVPPEGRLRPLDGLRAISILCVIVFHTPWFALQKIPHATYVALLHAPWMLPIWRGDFGVDVFFVLSGFLIAGILLDERAHTGSVRLGLFYVRRFLRLWPALAVVVALDVATGGDRSGTAWATLLYVSNLVPVVRVCMGWTWSLALEEQFYLVCPWLLRALAPASPRARVTVLASIGLALCFVAAAVVAKGPFFAFDAEIAINRPFERWRLAYDTLYAKPWMRAGPLVVGVIAAVLFRMPAVMSALSRAKVGATLGLLVALAVGAASTEWSLVHGASRAVEVAYLASYRVVFACAVAFVMLLTLSDHPVGRALGRALSARALFPIAQLAYSAYLLNPFVAMWTHRMLGARMTDPASAMAVLVPVDILLTFTAAALLYLLVERPFMALRPGGSPRPQ